MYVMLNRHTGYEEQEKETLPLVRTPVHPFLVSIIKFILILEEFQNVIKTKNHPKVVSLLLVDRVQFLFVFICLRLIPFYFISCR
jgi:hypothetical protein